jgi:hypothetical protein
MKDSMAQLVNYKVNINFIQNMVSCGVFRSQFR